MEKFVIKFHLKTPADCTAVLEELNYLGNVPILISRNDDSYHIWLFLTEELPTEHRWFFGRFVTLAAGVPEADIYPDFDGKRPCSLNNHKFVPVDDLDDTERYDTPAIIAAIHDGLYRIPAELITNNLQFYNFRSQPGGIKQRHPQKVNRPKPPWTEAFKHEDAGFRVLKLFDKEARVNKLGKAFKCPVHPEKHPSASFVLDSNGLVVFHDWHAGKYHLEDVFFTLPELYAALKMHTELRKLPDREHAAIGEELSYLLGYRNKYVLEVERWWCMGTQTLISLGVLSMTDDLHGYNQSFRDSTICKRLVLHQDDTICKRLVVHPCPADYLSLFRCMEQLDSIARVWIACVQNFIRDAVSGNTGTVLSKRYLAARADVPPATANRLVNFWCVLGLLEKAPIRKHGAKVCADSYTRGSADEAQIRRRWEALDKPTSLREIIRINRHVVAERLGQEVANAIYRRSADYEEPVCESCGRVMHLGKLEGRHICLGCALKEVAAITSTPGNLMQGSAI